MQIADSLFERLEKKCSEERYVTVETGNSYLCRGRFALQSLKFLIYF